MPISIMGDPKLMQPKESHQGYININFISFFRYWWMYGINFLIYIVTSERLRAAYIRFLQDVRLFVRNVSGSQTSESQVTSETHRWWSKMKELGSYQTNTNSVTARETEN